MNIGLITGEYPPMQGGVGDFTRELAHALVELGHVAYIITSANIASSTEDSTIKIEAIVSGWNSSCWRVIAHAAQRLELDLLNIQYEPAAYAMQWGINVYPWWYRRQDHHVPVVTTFHDLLVPYLFPKAGRLRWKIVEFLARHSNAIIVTNEEDRLKLTSSLGPATHDESPNSRMFDIPIGSNINPAPTENLDRERERVRWGADKDAWLIAYFGFLNMSKGGQTLMQAISILTEQAAPARLLLIGGRTGSSDPSNTRYAAEVDDAIASLGIADRVRHTGFVDARQVSAAMVAADVLVLPYADGLSFRRGSLMAALAHGKAIVSTRPQVELPQVIDGRNCLLVEPHNAQAVAAAIQRVMRDADLRARLEAGALELSRQFTWDKIAAQTFDVYGEVV